MPHKKEEPSSVGRSVSETTIGPDDDKDGALARLKILENKFADFDQVVPRSSSLLCSLV